MSLKFIGVLGLTISHDTGSQASLGTFTVISIPSIKNMADNKGIYRGTLSFSWAGGNYSGGTPGTGVATGTINVTSTKNKADNQFVIRVDDTGTMNGTIVNPSGGTIPIVNASVKITNAGQSKVRGE